MIDNRKLVDADATKEMTRMANEAGFKFGEIHPEPAEPWIYFPESTALQKAFVEGWKEGQDWYNERQE